MIGWKHVGDGHAKIGLSHIKPLGFYILLESLACELSGMHYMYWHLSVDIFYTYRFCTGHALFAWSYCVPVSGKWYCQRLIAHCVISPWYCLWVYS